MSAEQLPEPGVEVLQVFRTTTPTVIRPQLQGASIGVAKQILSVLADDGAGGTVLNPDANVSLPAFAIAKAATGNPAKYTGLNGLQLLVQIDNAPAVAVVFSDPTAAGLTPATVVSQVNAALTAAGVTSAVAETVGTTQWRLRTLQQGEFASLLVATGTSASVASAFEFGVGRTYQGVSNYERYSVQVPAVAFPDPQGNLDQLVIEQSTIRAFLIGASALSLQELSRTSAVLRNGSPITAAVVTGSVAVSGLTLPSALNTQALTLAVDGGAQQTVTFTTSETTPALVVAKINADTTGLVATLNGSNQVVLTSDTFGAAASIQVVASAAATTLGLAVGTQVGTEIQVVDDGNGDALSPLVNFPGVNFATAASAAVVTAAGNLVAPADGTTLVLSDGGQPQTITFASAANIAAVVTQINAVMAPAAGGKITASDASGKLRLTHATTGTDSVIHILGGTALSALDPGPNATLVVGSTRGNPNVPVVGDTLFIDGVEVARIIAVSPGGVTSRLKVSKQLPITLAGGQSFWIVANGLPAVNRPDPELQISSGNVLIKQDLLRSSVGSPLDSRSGIYLSFRAVRKDVTARARRPGLLRLSSTTELESLLSPITADNPLALGGYFGILNSNGGEYSLLGVDEVSSDAPFGTPEAFARAATLLESYGVYALAPLTHDPTVAQILVDHVNAMSLPENKGERIVIINPEIPQKRNDTLVASGKGNSVGSSGLSFDTGLPNLSSLVQRAGVSPLGTIPVTSGLYLDIAADGKRYSISSIAGGVVGIRVSFGAGENDDGYFATTDLNDPPLTLQLIDQSYAVKIKGAPLVLPDGSPDLDGIAATIQGIGKGYKNRRVWMVVPDRVTANIGGLEQELPGFYLSAAIAAMVGGQRPSQSFTNLPIGGFTGVKGSNDTFSRRQMNVMAAGGAWIVVQKTEGAALTTRMALTTDMTSIESRTDNVTKVVDFTAYFIRRAVEVYIGRYNISKGLLETLNTVIQGLLSWLKDNGVLDGGTLNQLIQNPKQKDSVLVDITLEVPYAMNYINAVLNV